MGLLARRNLFHDKVRFTVTLTGIVFALVLVIIQFGLFLDESGVSKLRVGERAYVTAEAYGTHKFWGHVIRVGRILGRKNIRTDEPSEHVDTKILETLVELDRGQSGCRWG